MSQADKDFQDLFKDEDNNPREMVWVLWKFLTEEQKLQAIKKIKHEN